MPDGSLGTALDFPVMDVSFYLTVGVEPVSATGYSRVPQTIG